LALEDQIEDAKHDQQTDQEDDAHYPTENLDHAQLLYKGMTMTSEVHLQFPLEQSAKHVALCERQIR
jgi:hypothetical protein